MGGLFIYSFLEPIILFYQMDAGMSCNILNWVISSESLTFICPDWQKFAAFRAEKSDFNARTNDRTGLALIGQWETRKMTARIFLF